jgi:hypothetical protein
MELYFTKAELARELKRDPATLALRILRRELRPDARTASIYLFRADRIDEIRALFDKLHPVAELDAQIAAARPVSVDSPEVVA